MIKHFRHLGQHPLTRLKKARARPDLIASFYNASRSEMLERMKMRDQALFAYILTTGAYFGFLFNRPAWPTYTAFEILANNGLSLLSLTFTLVILQHDRLIGSLGAYISTELLRGQPVIDWDRSNARSHGKDNQRFWAQFVTLLTPASYELFYCLKAYFTTSLDRNHQFLLGGSVLLSGGIIADVIYLHIAVKRFRGSIRKLAARPHSLRKAAETPSEGE